MKKIVMVFVSIFISMLAFSNKVKLPQSYNQNGTWNICVVNDDDGKTTGCSIALIGNPYKELEIYEAADPHGMYILYKDLIIVASGGEDLKVIKANSDYSYLENKNLKSKKPNAEYATFEEIGIAPESSSLIGLLTGKRFKDLKFFDTKNASEIAVKYYNLTFVSEDTDLILQEAKAWN